MADSGWIDLTTFANVTGIGSVAWSDPQDAESSNDVWAKVGASSNWTSNYLRGLQLVSNIPNDAVIDGIECRIERFLTLTSAGGSADSGLWLVKNGVIGGTNQGDGAGISTSEAYRTFGGPTDLWGRAWTDTDINASNFGMAYTSDGAASGTANLTNVDHIQLKIYYTESSDMFLTI